LSCYPWSLQATEIDNDGRFEFDNKDWEPLIVIFTFYVIDYKVDNCSILLQTVIGHFFLACNCSHIAIVRLNILIRMTRRETIVFIDQTKPSYYLIVTLAKYLATGLELFNMPTKIFGLDMLISK